MIDLFLYEISTNIFRQPIEAVTLALSLQLAPNGVNEFSFIYLVWIYCKDILIITIRCVSHKPSILLSLRTFP